MITHLYIRNFVLIEELSLDFEPGFSVFIGETGAGKSILIDAISLLYRERASTSYIAKGQTKAIIEGTFDLSRNPGAMAVLQEAGLDADARNVTFTRELLNSGRSTARIDHRIVSVSLMRDCLSREIDIHNQRDSQYLLNAAGHVDLLDRYLNLADLRQETASAYEAWQNLENEKQQVLNNVYNENDLEYFRYQLQEIRDADLKPGEDEELADREKQYKLVKDSYEQIQALLQLYASFSDSLYDLMHRAQSLKEEQKDFAALKQQISDSYYQLDDAMQTLDRTLSDFDFDEDTINSMEERLFTIQKLKRKYGRSIEEIQQFAADLEQRIQQYEHRQEYLKEIDEKIAAARSAYDEAAARLHQKRQKGAGRLEKEIAGLLKELALPNAVFVVHMEEDRPSRRGSDHVEFYISMNRGQDPQPLVRTASGGELSRLMLGLKVIFTGLQQSGTVIFDEIDSGVSGAVATAMGQMMRRLAKEAQVFSVTHLAPVAASAQHHYLVEKSQDETHTRTSVHLLNRQDTIREIARIASGRATEASLKAAEELIRRNGGQ